MCERERERERERKSLLIKFIKKCKTDLLYKTLSGIAAIASVILSVVIANFSVAKNTYNDDTRNYVLTQTSWYKELKGIEPYFLMVPSFVA